MPSTLTADLLLACGCETGESPVWDEVDQRLWWTDIPGKRLHRLDILDGGHQSFDLPGRVGSFALRRQGGVVVAMEHGFSFFDPSNGALREISNPEAGLASHRFNDGRCDRQGRFLAGSMNLARNAASAQLWRLDGALETTALLNDCTVANGLAFDAAGETMYWVDGGRRQAFRFAYGPDGAVGDRELFLEDGSAPGRPDGGAVDSEGCYWSARWMGGCVARFTPAGKLDRIITVPVSRVTMCAFGDRDFRTLFITTAHEGMDDAERKREPLAGAVFAVRADVAGLPEPRFVG